MAKHLLVVVLITVIAAVLFGLVVGHFNVTAKSAGVQA